MLGSFPLGTRPLTTAPRLPRSFAVAAQVGEFGWAAWSFSRQAKLNSWSWHSLGDTSLYAWAALGNNIYVRKEADSFVHIMQPDVFLASDEASTDSDSVEATTQWLDFGKPGKTKTLSGFDFDGQNVTTVEVYVSLNGGRTGTLAASFAVGQNNGGWTYNGEMIPAEEAGAATEFKLRFIGDAKQEVQVNRLTIYYDEIAA